MLNALKVAHKFVLLSITQLAILATISWFALSQMNHIGHQVKEIANDHLPLTNTLTLITEHQLQQALAIEKVISHLLLDALVEGEISPSSIKMMDQLNGKLTDLHDEIMQAEITIVSLRDDVMDANAKAKYGQILKEYSKIKNEFFALETLVKNFLVQVSIRNIRDSANKITAIEKANEQLDTHLIAVLNEIQNFVMQSAERAYQYEQNALKVIVIAVVVAIVLAIMVAFSIGRSITQPLRELLARLDDLVSGNGDLTIRMNVNSRDELGAVASKLNLFMEKLARTITGVAKASASLNNNSESAI